MAEDFDRDCFIKNVYSMTDQRIRQPFSNTVLANHFLVSALLYGSIQIDSGRNYKVNLRLFDFIGKSTKSGTIKRSLEAVLEP